MWLGCCFDKHSRNISAQQAHLSSTAERNEDRSGIAPTADGGTDISLSRYSTSPRPEVDVGRYNVWHVCRVQQGAKSEDRSASGH